MTIDRADAVKWLTINPAKALGIDKVTGSLEAGKNADVVIWTGDPFSVYSRAEQVFIDGALMYDRNDPAPAAAPRLHHRPRADGRWPMRSAAVLGAPRLLHLRCR